MPALLQIANAFFQHKSAQNFLIIAAIAAVQIINNVLLGRALTEAEFGLYSLVFLNLVNLISNLVLFGQGATIIRNFSSKSITDYAWKTYVLMLGVSAIIPVAILSYLPMLWYEEQGYDWLWFFFTSGASIFMFFGWIVAALLRANGRFNASALIERASPLVFFLAILFPYLMLGSLEITYAATAKLFSFFYTIPIFLYILFRWKHGAKKIDKHILFDGLVLWEMSLTAIAFYSIDALIIGRALGLKNLALYSILLAITRPFEFAYTAVFNVYSQKFSRKESIDIRGFLKRVILVAGGLSVFFIALTDILLDVLFDGKYQASLLLITLICAYKSIGFLYVLPSCYMIGQASRKEVRLISLINILSIIIKILLIIALLRYGLVGFLIAGIFGVATRTAGAYFIAFKGGLGHRFA